MSFQSIYKQFLAAPNSSQLATDAALHYITTTTTFKGAADIIKHLSTQRNQIKKKKEDVLTTVEGDNVLVLELDTAIEFVISGGTYLPGLDDNFLADRTVNLPIMHIVTFDADGKIVQIRQSWDQGAMLKQVDVIGKTGRNWPIRDSQEQIKMITNAAKSVSTVASTQRKDGPAIRSHKDSNASPVFGTREENTQSIASVISPRGGVKPKQRGFDEILGEEAARDADTSVISPRGGARPRQRSFHDIVGEEDDDDEEHGSPSSGRGRSRSPNKAIAPKAGVAKKFASNRLFDKDEETEQGESHGRGRSESPFKPFAPKAGLEKKFQPSRLFNEEDEEHAPENNGKGPELFYRPNPKRFDHFELGDGSDTADAPEPVPEKKTKPVPTKTKHTSQWSFDDFVTPQKVAPTRTLQKNHQDTRHWGGAGDDLVEEDEQPAQRRIRPSAEVHFDLQDDDTPVAQRTSQPRGVAHNDDDSAVNSKALGNITNATSRTNVFGSHFTMSDESPAQKENQPINPSNKGTSSTSRGIHISGNGMGGPKENPKPANKDTSSGRGILIGGDGMGGAKGTNRDWMFGETDEEETQRGKAVPGKKQGGAAAGGFNWDF